MAKVKFNAIVSVRLDNGMDCTLSINQLGMKITHRAIKQKKKLTLTFAEWQYVQDQFEKMLEEKEVTK